MATEKPLITPRIASPCTADWDAMAGDERVRFCSECNLHVYNLSDMTSHQAATFLSEAEGRTCVRFYRRADGTYLTRDCPTGLAAVRRKIARLAAGAAALFSFITLGLFSARATEERHPNGPLEKLVLHTMEPPHQEMMWEMGDVCMQPPLMPPVLSPPPPIEIDPTEIVPPEFPTP